MCTSSETWTGIGNCNERCNCCKNLQLLPKRSCLFNFKMAILSIQTLLQIEHLARNIASYYKLLFRKGLFLI